MPADYEDELLESFPKVLGEADELYAGRGRLHRTYDNLATRLSELEIPHALMGGFALILHGVRRFTEDIDVLVTEEGLRRLREHLIG